MVAGWINTRIILGILFYLLVTPFGLVMRLFGKKDWNYHGFNTKTKSFYDENGFDIRGYDKKGYDKKGYDLHGFDIKGIHKKTKTKFDEDGYDKQRFGRDGYAKDGSPFQVQTSIFIVLIDFRSPSFELYLI